MVALFVASGCPAVRRQRILRAHMSNVKRRHSKGRAGWINRVLPPAARAAVAAAILYTAGVAGVFVFAGGCSEGGESAKGKPPQQAEPVAVTLVPSRADAV